MDSLTFNAAVEPHLGMLRSTALNYTRNDADADDLVQETMLRAWRAWDRFDGRFVKAWLLRIMRNAFINTYRAKKRRPMETSIDMGRGSGANATDGSEWILYDDANNRHAESGADDFIEWELSPDVERALQVMPETFRDAVLLVDVSGLTYQEAADALEVPIGTIMSRVHRGRKQLAKRLDSREYLN